MKFHQENGEKVPAFVALIAFILACVALTIVAWLVLSNIGSIPPWYLGGL